MERYTFMRNGVLAGQLDLTELALITSQFTAPEKVPDICLAALATFFTPETEN
jgi:hypothetical protein